MRKRFRSSVDFTCNTQGHTTIATNGVENLDREGYKRVIQVLDAVGFIHLEGIMGLTRDQDRVFDKIDSSPGGQGQGGQAYG